MSISDSDWVTHVGVCAHATQEQQGATVCQLYTHSRHPCISPQALGQRTHAPHLAKGVLILPCVTWAAIKHHSIPKAPKGTLCARCPILCRPRLEASSTLAVPLHTQHLACVGTQLGYVQDAGCCSAHARHCSSDVREGHCLSKLCQVEADQRAGRARGCG